MPTDITLADLQKQIAALRKDLTSLIFEIDHTIFYLSEELETEYMEKVGQLEYKSLKTQYDILRIKRKIEIVKELIDNGRMLDLEFVDKIVDIDFEEQGNLLQEQSNLLKLALARGKDTQHFYDDLEKLNSTYKELLALLHPSLHPEPSAATCDLFQKAVTAYVKKDSPALQGLLNEAQCLTAPLEPCADIIVMSKVKTDLENAISATQEHLSLLAKTFPFNTLELLQNEELLVAKINELKEHINYYEMHYARYEKQLNALIATREN